MLLLHSGSIHIDGLDLNGLPVDVIRRRLNTIPQDPVFLPGTIRENLDPSALRKDDDIVSALQKVRLGHILTHSGRLSEQLQSDLLSHGERQLFMLAAAMLRKSKVILVDEPTSLSVMFLDYSPLSLCRLLTSSRVDQETSQQMLRLINEEFKQCTVIVVSHDVAALLECDRILLLNGGEVKGYDTPEAMLPLLQ